MAGSRKLCKNKNYFNHNSMNALFLIVYTTALIIPTHSSTLETKSNKISCSAPMTCIKCTLTPKCVWSLKLHECGNRNQFKSSSLTVSMKEECPQLPVTCSHSMTCTKCTLMPNCVWSLKQQECMNKFQFNSSSLIVSKTEECPQFSVVKKYDYNYGAYIHIDYIVEITNDLVGFINYINSTRIRFKLNTYVYVVSHYVLTYKVCKIINENNILCSFQVNKLLIGNFSITFFSFIRLNYITIKFDNVADHYVTVYGQKECATDENYKSCATCAWDSNYIKWCSLENTCGDMENLYIKNDGLMLVEDKTVAYVKNDCPEINVTAVEPLFGPETGGTTITITVRNHRILAENRTVMVTMAGTVCANPRSSGLETITCTTSQSIGTLSGPVLVKYSSVNSLLKIESSQVFNFCLNPVLDADQQLGGVASGGTSVPVRGDHFVGSCFKFLLYVDLADGVRQYADRYCDPPVNETYMVCRSPRMNCSGCDRDDVVAKLLNFGLMVKTFTDNQSLHINRSSHSFYVHPNPVLEDFVIDEAGSVVINGYNLQHILLDDIMVRFVDSPSKVCVVVSVTPHSLVCKPTMPVTELQKISVTLGNSLVFAVIRRASTHHDDPSILPGWFLATTVVVVFGCVFACYLRKKHWYNVRGGLARWNSANSPTGPNQQG